MRLQSALVSGGHGANAADKAQAALPGTHVAFQGGQNGLRAKATDIESCIHSSNSHCARRLCYNDVTQACQKKCIACCFERVSVKYFLEALARTVARATLGRKLTWHELLRSRMYC